jgi:hypothetical protein
MSNLHVERQSDGSYAVEEANNAHPIATAI